MEKTLLEIKNEVAQKHEWADWFNIENSDNSECEQDSIKASMIDDLMRASYNEALRVDVKKGEPEGENKPDFDLFILTLNHIVESGHNDIRFREAAERFIKPLQQENKTLRQQLEYYADKNQNQ